MKAVIFDLDGTLIDSVPDLHKAANILLEAHARPVLSLETVRSFVGNGVGVLVEKICQAAGLPIDNSNRSDIVSEWLSYYDEVLLDNQTVVFPGVTDCLKALKEKGIFIGLCTNKPQAPTHVILKDLGFDALFDKVIGGDTLPQRKPSPEPLLAALEGFSTQDCLFVGDSEVDAATADAAGVPCALYEEGYRQTPIDALPHAFSFSDYSALVAYVEAKCA